MKKSVCGLFLVFFAINTAIGQVGIGTTTPNAHAVLELKSPANNQGFMIPALTSAQRTATSLTNSLGTGDNGLLVFDSDDKIFYYWNGIQWDPIAHGSGTGTVTNLSTGTGLTGGPISTSGTISLANTAVTAGTYGSATSVGQFIVDAQGRLTSAGNISISGVSPAGTAGGDLGGSFPNPSVIKLQGSAISSTAPTANQVLKWSGTSWLPSPDANSGGTVTSVASGTGLSGGPITGTGTLSLANTAVTAGTYGSATSVGQFIVDAQGRLTSAGNISISGVSPAGTAGGDLGGSFPNPSVTKLQGSAVSSTAPTANQVLKWSGTSWLPSPDANSGGTVTSVASGTGLTGGPITGAGTLSLANTAVTAGTYGTSTQVGQFIVDAQGRITSASNVTITGAAPTGGAGGDLSGSFPNPSVIKLQGSAVSSTAPTANQVLKWSGTSWLPSPDANSGGTVTSVASGTGLTGGPITGAGTLSLANTAVTAGTFGTSTQVGQFIVDAQGRITSASNVTITGAAPTGAAGGDLTGSYPNPTIGTNAVNATKMAAGDYSTKINSGTYAISISGNATTATTTTNFSGALAGDVTGTQGATLVSKLQGSAVSSTAPTANQVLKWSGTSWLPSPDANSGGTVTSIASGTGLTGGPITGAGTLSLANTAVTAGTYGTSTQVGQFIVDAQGRITSASNVTITGAAPSGAAGGDLTGTYPNPTIGTDKVTTTNVLDGTLTNNDISATAAIVDTKLATISTAGKVSGNAITSGTIGGSTAINTSGFISTSSGLSASSAANPVIAATNTSTGVAVSATAGSGHGVYAYSTGGGRGVWGYSPSGIGVEGQSNTSYGVLAYSATGSGVYSTTGNTSGGYGVYGEASGTTSGEFSTYGYGVFGKNIYSGANGYLGGNYGVYGYGNNGTAVYGDGGTGYGVFGNGYIGVYGYGSSTGYGGYFYGPNWALYASGKAGGSQAWVVSSDRRFKKNIEPLSDPLNKILRLRGVTYDWRRDEFPDKGFEDKKQLGFIAQEIKEVLPEVVSKDEKGYYSVAYEEVVPVLVEAIKEQQKLIAELNGKLTNIEKEHASLGDQVATLKALVERLASPEMSASRKHK